MEKMLTMIGDDFDEDVFENGNISNNGSDGGDEDTDDKVGDND